MPEYLVTWCIELTADTPEEAARQVLQIHRDPHSLATVFEVRDPEGVSTTVDLEEGD